MLSHLRVGFLSPHNPFDRQAFSGTAYFMYRALSQRGDVQARVLGPHRPPSRLRRFARLAGQGAPAVDPARLDLSGLDGIIGLAATVQMQALLPRTEIPIVHVTDATPGFIRSFYGNPVSEADERREVEVVRGAALTVYSSDYMAKRAVEELGADPARVASVPFGINIEVLPEAAPDKPPLDPLRLLWVGNDWGRKGGQIALETVAALRADGVDARLSLVGDVPRDLALPQGAERIGYLDKARPRDAARLTRLFAEAHLFVLPTRADCTPMVVAEANAHATPVLITETGGIGSLIAAGTNGRMMAMEAGPRDWAAAVRDLTGDPARHAALCRTSFDHAHARLTWGAWARDVTALLRRAVSA
ncbi:glycosyltransferase family 4 protein [Aquicoccus sp. SU-CL01552]|uniref:glycosyltransferase family 4 protein n=1 Tax=Aquicoccus sp. SU-CL01552 TaxID=3127656 RepID=UPI003102ACC9